MIKPNYQFEKRQKELEKKKKKAEKAAEKNLKKAATVEPGSESGAHGLTKQE